MSDVIELRVGGVSYSSWTEARVSRELKALASDFEFTIVRDPTVASPVAPAVQAGDSCTVFVGGVLQLTGWVDKPDFRLTRAEHRVTISGRGRTGDLVDCSALNNPGTWTNRKAEQIIADLLSPFGIAVSATVDTGAAFPSFSIQAGEKVHEVMQRVLKQRAMLAIETPTGDVQLIRPAQTTAAFSLEQGVNFLEGQHADNMHERFSMYVLKGQSQGKDSKGDWLTGAPPTKKWSPMAQATDPGVSRYRPLELIDEGQAYDTTLQQRAQWEATVRAGQSRTATLSCPTWRDPTGAIWSMNQLVPVSASALALDQTLLVAGVHFRITTSEQITDVDVTPKEAYSLLDLPDPKKPKKGRKRKGPDPLLSLQ